MMIMRAMVISGISDLTKDPEPLRLIQLPVPQPGVGEVRIRVSVCGVCHTEIDEIEGRTPPNFYPRVPGHQVVGIVEEIGADVKELAKGDRVGVAWIHSACGECEFCRSGQENMCEQFRATGRDVNGGYAEMMTVPEHFAYRISKSLSDVEAAPLLCAGAIGYRSLRLAQIQDGQNLGLAGFGGSAHLVLKLIHSLTPGVKVFVFSRSEAERRFASELGADWAGGFDEKPPTPLHAIIDTTPAWMPVLNSLRNLNPGGRLVINAIRKENVDVEAWLGLDYSRDLWMEKEIKSVANVTRIDVQEFLDLAARFGIKPETQVYKLEEANQALVELKSKKIRGSKVLIIENN